MNKEEIKQFLRSKPGYSKFGAYKLAKLLNCDEKVCYKALGEIRKELKNVIGGERKIFEITLDKQWKSGKDLFRSSFLSKLEDQYDLINSKPKEIIGKNVLVIGDLHEPFCLKGYLKHCLETYKKYNCDEVVFIGDIIDNHASSYHETDPDGHSAGQELKLAINRIQQWYKAFPKATVIIGNHDRLIMRKAYTAGLSRLWIKDYPEVLGTPGWSFKESVEIDDVLYIHGEGGTARNRVKSDLQSIVQGHLHTQCYTEWYVGAKFKIFGMQVGCGIDHKSYAMAYAKENKKPAIACGVVLKGKTPINCMMEL